VFKYFEPSKFWVPIYYASEMRKGKKCLYSAWTLATPSSFKCRNIKQLKGREKKHQWWRWEDAVGSLAVPLEVRRHH